MPSFLNDLSAGWRVAPANTPETPIPSSYRCQCGRAVFFRNSQCVACGTALGYDPVRAMVLPLLPLMPAPTDAAAPLWQAAEGFGQAGVQYKRCTNFDTVAGCNWLLSADEPATLCIACRLNRTIPDLSDPENQALWRRIEIAKRRLVAQLLRLGLPVKSRVSEDPQGFMFDLLRSSAGSPPVMTGHDEGLITLNAEEADDARREQVRQSMHEPYRTMLGHFRHEVGHYYWDRLVRDTEWLEPFRLRFGDERADYQEALNRHYQNGPDPDWPQRCVSAYASMHPWEDWAETWAHYLHMVDTMLTARGLGINGENIELEIEPFTLADLDIADSPDAERFLQFINTWVELAAALNELARAMGQQDQYPFVLSRPAIAKLHFVHRLVSATREATNATPEPTPVTVDPVVASTAPAVDEAPAAVDTAPEQALQQPPQAQQLSGSAGTASSAHAG
ncbi:zinc-binding metallopeptidase family protein [Aquincola tertiaricarbonis]|uniref:zinc-binding metallopeptidase family protein n=1 Tax=Aquincola tertiaricarbonis TaxID=391953 RepID=UPI0009FA0AB5|nr:putative zinc-binding metallopeptidase [Aquincola tertiaricarbonis]